MSASRQRYTADKLLYSGPGGTFIEALNVEERRVAKLLAARKVIRDAIRARFSEIRQRLAEGKEVQGIGTLADTERNALKNLTPKFKPQGSYVYKTMNVPARTPPQQIDIDDGVYLPMEVFKGQPIVAKRVFFSIVDGVMNELAIKHDWDFEKKETCARVTIDRGAHIDVPLYAIPRDKYLILDSARAMAKAASLGDIDEDQFALREDEVHLAKRSSEHWVISDPMKIQKWFKEANSRHSRLRRICRYLKAWRDHTWEKGGPSSIVLMICAAKIFDEQAEPFTSDSAALLAVSERLPDLLNGLVKIHNPSDHEEVVFPRDKDLPFIADISAHAQLLRSNIAEAFRGSLTESGVISKLTAAFGTRIPNDPRLVDAIAIADLVRNTPAKKTEQRDPPGSMRSAVNQRSG